VRTAFGRRPKKLPTRAAFVLKRSAVKGRAPRLLTEPSPSCGCFRSGIRQGLLLRMIGHDAMRQTRLGTFGEVLTPQPSIYPGVKS
jgi:hypothetical protein